MQLKHLRSFIAVAQKLHFRQAASSVGVTQPALSHHIAQLERDVGARLLERDRRRVELTKAGEALLHGAQTALARLEEAASSAKSLGEARARTLVVGQLDYISHAYLPAAIRTLKRKFPDAVVETEDLGSDAALRAVKEGRVDVGFALGSSRAEVRKGLVDVGFSVPPVEVDDLVVRDVLRGHWMVMVCAKSELAKQESVALTELAGRDLILFQRRINPTTYDWLLQRCEKAGFTPKVAHHVAQAHHGPPLVAQGVGAFIVGSYVLRELPEQVVARPLTGFPTEITIMAAWRPGARSALLRAFLEGLPDLRSSSS